MFSKYVKTNRKNLNFSEYFYAKGVLVGIATQNFFLIIFLIITSSKDGFEFLGLTLLWFVVVAFSLAGICYFWSKSKEVSQDD